MTYENFLTRIKELAPGCKPEAIPCWRDFAVDAVDSSQFLRFESPAAKTATVESWLDVLCSGFEAVRKECGPETVAALVDLGLEWCCLYPGEMMQAALCLEKGENGGQIFEKVESGEIDCTDLFLPISRRDAEGRRAVRERLTALKKRKGKER